MISIAIPTYQRGPLLIETLTTLLRLERPADEILVLDQTRLYPPDVDAALARWNSEKRIRWIRLPEPSIPQAMNRALQDASHDLVLFLDDDIIPSDQLVAAHRTAYIDENIWAVAGQVIETGIEPVKAARHTGEGFRQDLEFPFWSDQSRYVANVMAGNMSVRRHRALQIGGFDENFIGAAYRFETDFARRLVAAGGKIWFEPSASVRHLKLPTGGLRSFGEHLKSANPAHSVGDYYFAFTSAPPSERRRYVQRRLLRAALTRYHLRRPWWIVPKLIGEIRGLLLARRLARRGRRLLSRT